MSESSKTQGIGFLGLLTIAFVVLKLCGVISWRWLWVISPLFVVPIILLIGALIIGFFFVWAFIMGKIRFLKKR